MTMPAGDYYVGDLCYVLHDRWDEVCNLLFPTGEKSHDGEYTLSDGTRFAIYSTAFGDGVYYDQDDNEYGVDAGVIGCILVSDIIEKEQDNLGLGMVHTFPHDFETGYSEYDRNTIDFGGRVIIQTDPIYNAMM